MTAPTHATLATFEIDLTREVEQQAALDQHVVPGVRQFPGFAGGHWTLDRAAGLTHVLLTSTSREAAEGMVGNVRGNADAQAAAGLKLVSIEVLEVVASA